MILASSITTPDVGTIVWTTIIFTLLLILLRAFAWRPILDAIKAREESIRGSLESAEEARKEMERLKANNEAMLQEAREEYDELLKEARDSRDKMIEEAKKQAGAEADEMIKKARITIEREKTMAITDIKNQIAILSVEIAEKILKEKLRTSQQHNKLMKKLLNDLDLKDN
ncbi:MAG: F0F1 ATP synthase subunit B [Bacteroidota bacterium]